MKSFKEFLREEDAKASTSTAVVGEKENPPGGGPAPYTNPINQQPYNLYLSKGCQHQPHPQSCMTHGKIIIDFWKIGL